MTLYVSFREFGTVPSEIFWRVCARMSMALLGSSFKCSAAIPEGSAAFLFFRLLIADITVSLLILVLHSLLRFIFLICSIAECCDGGTEG